MQRSEWSEEAPAPKGRIPGWVWWVGGGGCLLALTLGAVLAFFLYRLARAATDPERGWADVAEVLPHDVRPAGWEARGVNVFGIETYVLTGPDHAGLLVQAFPTAEPLESLFDPAAEPNQGAFGIEALEGAELGTLELQGREVRCLRFRTRTEQESQAGLRIDLSGGPLEPHALVQLTVGADDPRALDEHARELLAPFDLWRGR